MENTPDFTGKARTQRTTFRQSVSVGISIDAPAAKVWGLLTNAANFPAWNSTVESIDGTIAEGHTIALKAKAADRVFKLKVSDVQDNQSMLWASGMKPMFRGERTYTLGEQGGSTTFHMEEVFSGLMFPMIRGSLPDFAPSFETYAADLKRAAEA